MRKGKQGARGPEGEILSSMLFNIYMSKIPILESDVHLIINAADIFLTISKPQVNKITVQKDRYLKRLNKWFQDCNLKVCAASRLPKLLPPGQK